MFDDASVLINILFIVCVFLVTRGSGHGIGKSIVVIYPLVLVSFTTTLIFLFK